MHAHDGVKPQAKHTQELQLPSKYHWTARTEGTLLVPGVRSSPAIRDCWPRPCSQGSIRGFTRF